MVNPLKKNAGFQGRRGPVVLVIMDGVGYGKYEDGDAVKYALTPNLDSMMKDLPTVSLKAHGTAVGLPADDDMGNSEVGHNAIGCGRVFAQGAKLVAASIESEQLYQGETWKKLVSNTKKNKSALHLVGLISDGNVHSHITHLEALVKQAKEEGVSRVRVHGLLDGRDVGETSALDYFDPLADFLADLSDDSFDARIASGGGRMVITMDRYSANWDMVRKGWETHVLGEGRQFATAHDAIATLREETGAIDQDLPPFVIAKDDSPVGPIEDGDSVILFNFRGDRALELTAAFESGDDFKYFDRKRVPAVEYAGMMEYDGDLHVPKQYLVNPPTIDRTMGEYLAVTGVKQFAISETQKFGHVTYFFNGNRSGKFDETSETYEEITSDICPFEERPWMKCADIADRVIEVIDVGENDFIRLNFPNGDMVGHTGIWEAVVCSIEALDLCIGRIRDAVKKAGGIMIISADHGNSDDMFERDKKTKEPVVKENGRFKAKTAHSLNPVPCIVYDPEGKGEYAKELLQDLGVSALAATTIELLGYVPPEDYDQSVLDFK
jgi:2,3-bisphosphoglycerate-independent phosphoglycerate mutase